MPLTHIEYGSLASSAIMNNNLDYLDDKITSIANTLSSNTSALYSNISSVNGTLTAKDDELEDDLDELRDDFEDFADSVEAVNNAPDYDKVISITLPHTASRDGYVYAGVNGLDNFQYVYVNNQVVHGHCGYSGGIYVYSGSLFRVSAGDVITSSRVLGNVYFYPMKGA